MLGGANAGKRWSAGNGGSEETPTHAFRSEGSTITGSVGIAGTRGTTTLAGTILGTGATIKCTGGTSTGTLAGAGVSTGESSLTGCSLREVSKGKETELTLCKVGAISLSDMGDLRFYGEELASELSPSSGTVFAKFAITGSECSLKKATNELTGSLSSLLPEAGTEKVEHQLSYKPGIEQATLSLDGNPATLEATETLKLAGTSAGKKWSAV